MDPKEICKIIEFNAAFLLILFSVFILSQKRGNPVPRFFLAAFFISRAFILISFALWNYDEVLHAAPDLLVIGEPILFLYAPFLFLYTQSATSNEFHFKWYYAFHFLPFLVILGYFLAVFHFQPITEKINMITSGSVFHSIITDNIWLWLQFAVYASGCIYMLHKYKKTIVRFNSSYNHEKLIWLNFLIIAFLAWKAIFISGYLTGILSGNYATLFKIFIELGFLFYASMIIFKGLQLPRVVLGTEKSRMYQTSPLKSHDKKAYLEKLEELMQQEKPYLEPELTLNDLAELCGIPVHYLSQILNENLNQNFYHYINSHRIEEAKRLLSDPEEKDITILEVLYAVGFNSKSVFNTAFKKQVGITPSDFKKKHRLKPFAA